MKKSSNISATALHRFIPQPASGRSSALPCLAANIVLSKLLWEIHLHGLKFIPIPLINKLSPSCARGLLIHMFLQIICTDLFQGSSSSRISRFVRNSMLGRTVRSSSKYLNTSSPFALAVSSMPILKLSS